MEETAAARSSCSLRPTAASDDGLTQNCHRPAPSLKSMPSEPENLHMRTAIREINNQSNSTTSVPGLCVPLSPLAYATDRLDSWRVRFFVLIAKLLHKSAYCQPICVSLLPQHPLWGRRPFSFWHSIAASSKSPFALLLGQW